MPNRQPRLSILGVEPSVGDMYCLASQGTVIMRLPHSNVPSMKKKTNPQGAWRCRWVHPTDPNGPPSRPSPSPCLAPSSQQHLAPRGTLGGSGPRSKANCKRVTVNLSRTGHPGNIFIRSQCCWLGWRHALCRSIWCKCQGSERPHFCSHPPPQRGSGAPALPRS